MQLWKYIHRFIVYYLLNIRFIQKYLDPTLLKGKSGYQIVNFIAAIEYIKSLDGKQL